MSPNARLIGPIESPEFQPYVDTIEGEEPSFEVMIYSGTFVQSSGGAVEVEGFGDSTFEIRTISTSGAGVVVVEYDEEDLRLMSDQAAITAVRQAERDFATGNWSSIEEAFADEDGGDTD